jgi:hypothetical protein
MFLSIDISSTSCIPTILSSIETLPAVALVIPLEAESEGNNKEKKKENGKCGFGVKHDRFLWD